MTISYITVKRPQSRWALWSVIALCLASKQTKPRCTKRNGSYRRKFRSQTSDNMDRWKSRGGKSQRGEAKKWEDQRKSEKKEDAGAREGRKVGSHCVLWMICGSGGSKSNLAKAAGAEPSGQMRDEKLHAVVAPSTFASEKAKKPHARTTFGSWDVEKVYAVMARSTFPSQNVQSTPCSDPFWKLLCRKSARRCGTKHISKSKV